MKGKKFYSDRERLETVKRLRASGLSITKFAEENGIAYSTLRDWAYAFKDLEGRFVRLDFDEDDPSRLTSTGEMTMHMLGDADILRKSNSFSRFDHSIVVIEYRDLKITTSLEQAMAILGRILP